MTSTLIDMDDVKSLINSLPSGGVLIPDNYELALFDGGSHPVYPYRVDMLTLSYRFKYQSIDIVSNSQFIRFNLFALYTLSSCAEYESGGPYPIVSPTMTYVELCSHSLAFMGESFSFASMYSHYSTMDLMTQSGLTVFSRIYLSPNIVENIAVTPMGSYIT